MNFYQKKINYVLALSVLAVWGIILFRLINVEKHSNPIFSDQLVSDDLNMILSGSESKSDSFLIVSLKRNPFETLQIRETNKITKSMGETSISPGSEFNYKINGVIINSNRKVIILEDIDSNKTVFLRENQSYRGLKINSILKSEIVLTNQSGQLTVSINSQ